MTINIIGIDCATDPKNVGLAFGEFDGQKTTIIEVKKPAKRIKGSEHLKCGFYSEHAFDNIKKFGLVVTKK